MEGIGEKVRESKQQQDEATFRKLGNACFRGPETNHMLLLELGPGLEADTEDINFVQIIFCNFFYCIVSIQRTLSARILSQRCKNKAKSKIRIANYFI